MPKLHITRLTRPTPVALALLHEYYEAVQVQVRDTPSSIAAITSDPASGFWIASLNDHPAGCVVLRPLPSIPNAGECKRLYVRPAARGHHVAAALMDTLEDFARTHSLHWIYLDSKDDLQPAISLYLRRGYTPCPRYNDNPQATVFLRKQLHAVPS